MADQTLSQLPDTPSAQDTDNIYATRNGNSIRMALAVALSSRVRTSRVVNTAGGLTGGGPLSADLNLAFDANSLNEDFSPDLANDFLVSYDVSTDTNRKVRMNRVGTGTGGDGNTTPSFSAVAVANQTNVTASTPGETINFANGSNVQITTDPTTKTVRIATIGLASNQISINPGAGLAGGGNLTANRNLSIDIMGQSEDTTPDFSADYVLVHDASAGLLRRVRLALLSASSYTLPTASPTRLGGIRIGSGFNYNETTGILSVAPTGTSYVLPPATDTTRGGVRVALNSGLILTDDVLSNANPTPYVLPVAATNVLGGVKQGHNINIAPDGTISASTGGGTDNSFRPETYGAIRGIGLTQQQRESNATAINACLTQAAVIKGRVDMGGGTWEIFGPLTMANVSNLRIEGDWCTIRQFQSGVSILTMTNVSQVAMSGFMLAYQANQTAGSDPRTGDTYFAALRLNAVTNCRFTDIDTRNAWVHIGLSGGAGSFSNTFANCRLNMATGQSWGLVYKFGNGNNFSNLRISGGTASQLVTGGVYVANVDQIAFTNLICETLDAQRTMSLVAVRAATVTGGVFSGIGPRAVAGYGCIVHGSTGTTVQMTGIHIGGTAIEDLEQAMAEASAFAGELGCAYLVANLTVTNTSNDGYTRFCLLGHTSAAPARNVIGTFQQVYLDTSPTTPHRIDELCVATVDPLSDSLTGPMLSYNNVLGELTGGLFSVGDESLTIYPSVHGRHIYLNSPLTAERAVTASRQIDRPYASSAFSAPRTVRGAMIRFTRSSAATGAALWTIGNHNGSSIVGLGPNQSVIVIYDGANYVMVPGSLSTGSGGTANVVYATSAEAITGTSTTTAMNPARTKEAYNAYAAANEITGVQGNVLGFDTAGNAAVVKMTRAIMVPLAAETTALTVGVAVRRISMPISLRLTAIRVFLPAAGTSGTTVDVNAAGVSILNAPITVAANTSSASSTSFTTVSNSTITQGTVVDFDIDAAGAGAKGAQVTLVGHEV